MRVDLLSREYPPEVYGGAGVHVDIDASTHLGNEVLDMDACTAVHLRRPFPRQQRNAHGQRA